MEWWDFPKVAVVVVILLVFGFLVGYSMRGNQTSELSFLALEGYSEADVGVDISLYTISLTSDCSQLVMATTDTQIYSIQKGLENRVDIRPTTHDLMLDVMEAFDIEVLMVKITDLQDGTYYARLVVKKEDKVLDLDVRPSDAVAMAVRTDTPVYIKESLLEQYGENIC